MTIDIHLREVFAADLSVFFAQQLNPAAQHMVAFGAADPTDRDAYEARWTKILRDREIVALTILAGGQVAGYVASFDRDGSPEVGYWIGSEFWGQGIATAALAQLLDLVKQRPLFARAAHDNIGSIRVLQKCGFMPHGEDEGYSNSRGESVREVIMKLGDKTADGVR